MKDTVAEEEKKKDEHEMIEEDLGLDNPWESACVPDID